MLTFDSRKGNQDNSKRGQTPDTRYTMGANKMQTFHFDI